MKRPIFLYILAVLLPLIGWAQERQMLSLPNREQLSSERVMEVMQDSEGFLWYATQGGGKYLNITTQPHSFNTNIIGK